MQSKEKSWLLMAWTLPLIDEDGSITGIPGAHIAKSERIRLVPDIGQCFVGDGILLEDYPVACPKNKNIKHVQYRIEEDSNMILHPYITIMEFDVVKCLDLPYGDPMAEMIKSPILIRRK